ncbi:MAG: homoserine dehydrogenase [Candidatus Omnitrophota bacterium]
MENVNIGLIGFGTVGTGLVKALKEKSSYLKRKLGIELNLKKICDKDIASPRSVKVEEGLLTTNVDEVLNDPQIKIIVELIGGIHPAKEYIIKALENGKDVVTANKALLAESWQEIFRVACNCSREVYFEASVGGGIPIIKALREGLISNELEGLFGIVNGTSNYILTQMEEKELDFKDALKEAQDKGYAEKDPSLDVKGIDSAHKLAILASLGFGKSIKFDDIYVEGIQDISLRDIVYAREFNCKIKLLAIAKRERDELEVRVHPTLVPISHPLSTVKGPFNAIFIKGDLVGEQLFYGQGAGAQPTSSAIISDIVDLALRASESKRAWACNLEYGSRIKGVKNIDEIETRYYMRFSAIDRPGVLAAIAGALGKNGISIASVIQKDRMKEQIVPIVLLSHEANERSLRAALNEIDNLPMIKRKSVAIRMEKDL